MSAALSRRQAMTFTGAGLVAAVTASAALAQKPADGPSPIRVLFEQWQRIQDEFDASAHAGMSDDEIDQWVDARNREQDELARQILDLPLRDAGDFVMKIVAATSYGDYGLADWWAGDGERIWVDARSVIAADVSAAPVVPVAIAAPRVSPELMALIAAHQKAHKDFNIITDSTDSVKLGREPTKAEERRWRRASSAEERALTAICSYPAVTPADLGAKGRYLRKFNNWHMGELQPEQVDALLRSMIGGGTV